MEGRISGNGSEAEEKETRLSETEMERFWRDQGECSQTTRGRIKPFHIRTENGPRRGNAVQIHQSADYGTSNLYFSVKQLYCIWAGAVHEGHLTLLVNLSCTHTSFFIHIDLAPSSKVCMQPCWHMSILIYQKKLLHWSDPTRSPKVGLNGKFVA